MHPKRVLLVESGKFIGGVISSLFSSHADLSLIEIFPYSATELIDAVKSHQVQVVVLDDTLHQRFLGQLLRFMQTSSDLRVVVVNADNNQVSVYEKQLVPVRQTADFFALL